MAKMQRRQFTDAYKKKMVVRLQGGMTVQQAGEKFDMAETVLRTWSRDPRYGGHANANRRRKGTNSHSLPASGLPMKRKSPAKRAKAAVAVEWKCPHCGELITIGGEA